MVCFVYGFKVKASEGMPFIWHFPQRLCSIGLSASKGKSMFAKGIPIAERSGAKFPPCCKTPW